MTLCLVDDLAGESPASASFPVGTVVISGDGAGDQTGQGGNANGALVLNQSSIKSRCSAGVA